VTRARPDWGDHAISRKAIAQGMSDVLRCPVCSCAALFALIAHETAGAARIRHSLRPLNFEGEEFQANLGWNAPRECEATSATLTCHARVKPGNDKGGVPDPPPSLSRRTTAVGRTQNLQKWPVSARTVCLTNP
jgi:hypothetical protein